MAESSSPSEYIPLPNQWVEGVFSSDITDAGLAADSFNPLESEMRAVVEGQPLGERLSHEQATDPGVIYKNLFLAKLAELADDPGLHVGDFLALLDKQAQTMDPANETRHRQFMGLWDILVALSKDENLMRFLRDRPENY